jgi:nucleoside-diphosphate-sugar epimerase
MKARIESYIRAQQNPSLFPYITFIYVGFYYQNFLTFFQPNADFEFRVLLQPTARLPLYDVQDTGPVVVQCFEHPDQWGQGNVVPIVAEQLTMDEICETIRRVTGNNKIQYIPLTYEQCVGQAKETLDNMRWYNEYGSFEQRHAEKTREVYNQMKTLEEWIRETRWLMNEKSE